MGFVQFLITPSLSPPHPPHPPSSSFFPTNALRHQMLSDGTDDCSVDDEPVCRFVYRLRGGQDHRDWEPLCDPRCVVGRGGDDSGRLRRATSRRQVRHVHGDGISSIYRDPTRELSPRGHVRQRRREEDIEMTVSIPYLYVFSTLRVWHEGIDCCMSYSRN